MAFLISLITMSSSYSPALLHPGPSTPYTDAFRLLSMWFKNLQVYRFTKPFDLTTEQLAEQLATKPFVPCSSQELSRYGWVEPLGQPGTEYIHAANGFIMICAKRQEKVLPAAVINETVAEQIKVLQDKEGRPVGRKERQNLKEEALFTLLPRAFSRSSLQYAYISPSDGLLIVNSGSAKRAEELISYLRETIGSVPVIPVISNNIPQHAMTSWIKQGATPEPFELGGECELRDTSDEKGIIRCKNQDLGAKEITNHIDTGMFATKLSLSWKGGIECVVDDSLAIKRLRFSDLIQEKADEVNAEDAAAQFDVDFSIMTMELSRFLKDLLNIFGGENLSECEESV
jgi:recombination associated protein RdgC